MTTQIHNSTTCQANADQPCEFCTAAIKFEQRQVQERVRKAMTEDDEKIDPAAVRRIQTALHEDKRFASVTTIRAALFDVFDQNVRELSANDCEKHRITDEQACENRFEFVEVVCCRIVELQSAPHNFDPQYADYCSGYADGWAAAHTETLRLQNEDLREMLRVGNERITR